MNNTNESGRSMVEMLGVLAIIGVLSVMGIAGYTQAMKKYRANEAAQEITMGAMLCGTSGNLGGFSGKYVSGLNCSGSAVKWTGFVDGVNSDAVTSLLEGAYSASSALDKNAKTYNIVS